MFLEKKSRVRREANNLTVWLESRERAVHHQSLFRERNRVSRRNYITLTREAGKPRKPVFKLSTKGRSVIVGDNSWSTLRGKEESRRVQARRSFAFSGGRSTCIDIKTNLEYFRERETLRFIFTCESNFRPKIQAKKTREKDRIWS